MGKASKRKQKKSNKTSQEAYFRANPMSPVLHKIWRSTCEEGFAFYGRGVLCRSVAVGLGKSAYVPLVRIDDPVGRQVVGAYDPAKEFVVAEPNEKGGTRWQVFRK